MTTMTSPPSSSRLPLLLLLLLSLLLTYALAQDTTSATPTPTPTTSAHVYLDAASTTASEFCEFVTIEYNRESASADLKRPALALYDTRDWPSAGPDDAHTWPRGVDAESRVHMLESTTIELDDAAAAADGDTERIVAPLTPATLQLNLTGLVLPGSRARFDFAVCLFRTESASRGVECVRAHCTPPMAVLSQQFDWGWFNSSDVRCPAVTSQLAVFEGQCSAYTLDVLGDERDASRSFRCSRREKYNGTHFVGYEGTIELTDCSDRTCSSGCSTHSLDLCSCNRLKFGDVRYYCCDGGDNCATIEQLCNAASSRHGVRGWSALVVAVVALALALLV